MVETMQPSVIKEAYTGNIADGVRITLIGSGVNLFLVLLKFAAGIFGHSQALIADAVHTISDLFTDVVVLAGLKLGSKAPDELHHFGHARFETLASSIVGIILAGAGVYIGIEAGLDIYLHEVSHPTWIALTAAIVSIVCKEAVYRYTIATGRRLKSSSLLANAWHHRSDAMSSVAVLIGVAGSLIHPAWHILDAFAALVVSFFILKVGVEIVWKDMKELTDTAPGPDVQERIKRCAAGVHGVLDVHDLRARSTGGFFQMELHVMVDRHLSVEEGHRIAKEVEACLIKDMEDVGEVIVHVDPSDLSNP